MFIIHFHWRCTVRFKNGAVCISPISTFTRIFKIWGEKGVACTSQIALSGGDVHGVRALAIGRRVVLPRRRAEGHAEESGTAREVRADS